MNITKTMTGYEARLYKCAAQSPADAIKSEKMLATSLRNILSQQIVETLDTGEEVSITLLDKLVITKIGNDLSTGKIDLKEYSSVLCEQKLEVSSTIGLASEIFKGCEVKK